MELTKSKEENERKMAQGAGCKGHAPGTKNGVYVSLQGRFASQQDKVLAHLPGDPRRIPAQDRNEKKYQQAADAGRKPEARRGSEKRHGGGHGGHGFRNSVRHGGPMYGGEEEYSSTCCGKCRYFLRQWRGGVWVCSNEASEKSGFPTNYTSTCPLFTHEDWSRDDQGLHTVRGN